MKVIERDTDRKAEVHIYVEGQVDALEEYGEYIDAKDSAICCYVPVQENHNVRIGGKFSGTTMSIAYDAIVDGVLRKASSYTAKSVGVQKNKKLDFESFLDKACGAVVDTAMFVSPIAGAVIARGEGKETIGAIELRLYITRQLGVTHLPGRVDNYDENTGNIGNEKNRCATYKLIAPTFQMAFEKSSETLDKARVAREHRKMNSTRPGSEPWAIFRFYYRNKGKKSPQLYRMRR
ncbi:hypothetical protein ACEQ8H_000227 [Pleosporales sp. CAS-2024a]